MKHSFKYILTALALLLSAVAFAQTVPPVIANDEDVHDEGKGIATKKDVSLQNSDGTYTLTLETWATGSSAIVQRSIPADIVLILDVSSSMGARRGSETAVLTSRQLSYQDVVDGYDPAKPDAPNYLRAKNAPCYKYNKNTGRYVFTAGQSRGSRYQLFGLERNGRYYLYWIHTSDGIYFLDENGNDVGPALRTDPNDDHLSNYNISSVVPPPMAAYSESPSAPIVTIPAAQNGDYHYSYIWTGSSRTRDLFEAVSSFIGKINENDYLTPEGTPRPQRLGNRLSIITFSGKRYGYYNSDTDFCSSRVISPLTTMSDEYAASLQDDLKNYYLDSGTLPTHAFNHDNNGATAQFELPGRAGKTVNEDYTRTVVFFTDGSPDGTGSDATSNWNTAISGAYLCKYRYKATVYSVALLSEGEADPNPAPVEIDPDDTEEDIQEKIKARQKKIDTYWFMHYTSSNFPNAMNLTTPGAGGSADAGYTTIADNETINLSRIFNSIAEAAGGASTSAGTSTQVRDVISSSFKLPIDTSTMTDQQIQAWADANVKVYTSEIASNGRSWKTRVELADAQKSISTVPETGAPQISVTNFDFTLDDQYDEHGFTIQGQEGNWIGERHPDGNASHTYYAGKKLIIEFKIVAIDNATGGNNTQTNAQGSGVYIYHPDEDTYDSVNNFTVPITNIPINLVIEKTGLRHGQSATFEIETCIAKRDSEGNIYYNEYGKPEPDVVPEDDPRYIENDINSPGWHNWSKIVLTNKGENGAKVTKTLRSLDARFIYRIVEDKWGWSYNMYGAKIDNDYPNTANQLTNPFRFHNEERTDAVKHAEAVVINHFATGETAGDAKMEGSYKSDKVESFESDNPLQEGTEGSGSGE